MLFRSFLPHMIARGSGHIINTGSIAGLVALTGEGAPYSASKFAVVGLSEALALYARPKGIGVSILCPGAVDTPFWDGISNPPDRDRMLRPEAVAEAALLVAAQPPEAFVEEIVLAPTPGVL